MNMDKIVQYWCTTTNDDLKAPEQLIDVALVSSEFGDDSSGQEHVTDALLLSDARIKAVPFLPDEFCDENPLVWEIKTKGIKLL